MTPFCASVCALRQLRSGGFLGFLGHIMHLMNNWCPEEDSNFLYILLVLQLSFDVNLGEAPVEAPGPKLL
jgi:hypothetical protein